MQGSLAVNVPAWLPASDAMWGVCCCQQQPMVRTSNMRTPAELWHTRFLACTSLWQGHPAQVSTPLLQKTLVTIALNTSSTSGYVAVGFPTVPTRMVGASSMVLAACSAGADCTGGVRFSQFYLGGEVVDGAWETQRCVMAARAG